MSDIRFVLDQAVMALDCRVPVRVIWTDEHGTATVEFFDGRRVQYGVEHLLPGECYICKGHVGEMKISAYGSVGRLRCVHAGPCPSANANSPEATPPAGGKE